MEFFPHETKLKFMELPRVVLIGPDALHDVPSTFQHLKLPRSAMVICDRTTIDIAGNKVIELLKTNGFDCHSVIIEKVDEETVSRVTKQVDETGVQTLIGIGGGRPIDIAKYCSAMRELPFFSIPTATSHDGIASGRAAISFGDVKASIEAHPPLAVIGDTGIIANSPYKLTASGCGDIIANYSAVADWKLAHRIKGEEYSNYAAVLSLQTAEMLLETIDQVKPNSEDSARFLLKALVTSGIAMSIAGSSRPASGSEHMFSHALDKISGSPGLHGEQCGVGAIMMMYLHGQDWEKIKTSLQKVKAPTTAKELGVNDEEVINALVKAHEIRPERYTILGEGLSRECAIEAATTTGVIGS